MDPFGNAVHATLRIKGTNLVLKMRDNGQQAGDFIRIRSVVSGKTIEQLHQFGVLHHAFIDPAHGGKEVELRDF